MENGTWKQNIPLKWKCVPFFLSQGSRRWCANIDRSPEDSLLIEIRMNIVNFDGFILVDIYSLISGGNHQVIFVHDIWISRAQFHYWKKKKVCQNSYSTDIKHLQAYFPYKRDFIETLTLWLEIDRNVIIESWNVQNVKKLIRERCKDVLRLTTQL